MKSKLWRNSGRCCVRVWKSVVMRCTERVLIFIIAAIREVCMPTRCMIATARCRASTVSAVRDCDVIIAIGMSVMSATVANIVAAKLAGEIIYLEQLR